MYDNIPSKKNDKLQVIPTCTLLDLKSLQLQIWMYLKVFPKTGIHKKRPVLNWSFRNIL